MNNPVYSHLEPENRFLKYEFVPNHRILEVLPVPSMKVIQNEPMLHSSDIEFALAKGGDLTRMLLNLSSVKAFIKNCPKERYLVLDSRTMMLMPGMYPAIPGWHCDAVKRPSATAQPDLEIVDPLTAHLALHFSSRYVGKGTVTSTYFANEPLTIDVDKDKVWGSVDNAVNQRRLRYSKAEDGELWWFNRDTLHRASASVARGWRWWVRLSYYHTAPRPQVRTQVQVYTTPATGW